MPRNGFTLLELLVVLAILGVLLLTVPAGLEALPGARLHAAERILGNRLRAARNQAIATGLPQTVSLDRTELPPGATLKPHGTIRFYLDGSASGGDVVLSDGARSYRIRIDRLTGRVDADD